MNTMANLPSEAILFHYILFDLDGTLTDPANGIIRSIQHACRALNLPAPEHHHLLYAIGPPIQSTFATLLNTSNADRIQAAVDLYRERYASVGMLHENSVYPGIEQLLSDLNAGGRRLFVATSKPKVYALPILRHFGLDTQFAAIHGSELDGTRADKSDLLAHILETERIQPSNAVMVGDRKHDILAARANSIRSIGVTYGYGSEAELTEAGADLLCDSVASLRSALLRS